MWIFELKRLMIKKRGILIIAAAFFIELLMLAGNRRVLISRDIEANKELYMSYIDTYGGDVTEEKAAVFYEKLEELEQAVKRAVELIDEYRIGSVTYEEVQAGKLYAYSHQKDLDVLRQIKLQMDYAVENGSGKIIYESGWKYLLGADYTNFIIPVLLILLIMPLFTEDYALQMDRLVKTGKNGGKALIMHRLAAAYTAGALLAAACMAADIIYVRHKYGLGNWNVDIKNIEMFSGNIMNNTLAVQLFMVYVQWLAGIAVITVIAALTGRLFKDAFYGAVMSLIIILFPVIIMEKETWFKWRMPISFFTDGGYINGIEIYQESRDIVTGMYGIYAIILTAVAGAAVTIFFAVSGLNFNMKKRITAITAVIFMGTALSGCDGGFKVGENDTFIWNDYECAYEAGEAVIFEEEGNYFVEKAGIRMELDDDPLVEIMGSGESCSNIRVNGSKVYFMAQRSTNWTWGIYIYELDTDTMERKQIYSILSRDDSYLGLAKDRSGIEEMLTSLAVAGDEYILLQREDGIYYIDRGTGRERELIKGGKMAKLYNGMLYYIDNFGGIYTYDFKTEKTEKLTEAVIEDYIPCEYGIIYIDWIDGHIKLSDGRQTTVLSDCHAVKIVLNGDDLYYEDKDNDVYRCNIMSGEISCMYRDVVNFSILPERGQMYCEVWNGGDMFENQIIYLE